MTFRLPLLFVIALLMVSVVCAEETVSLKLTGDWTFRVEPGNTELSVDPPDMITVRAEKYDSLPLFNPNGPPYAKATPLNGVRADECSTTGVLQPDSVVVRESESPNSTTYELGKDYQLDPFWGSVGRLDGGRIAEQQTVFIDYIYVKKRLDSVVKTKDGRRALRKGEPHVTTPKPPVLQDGDVRLANIFFNKRIEKLTEENLFPILESAYPEPPPVKPTVAERLIPKTMQKLYAGQKVRILAWGDSVTDGTYGYGYLIQSAGRWQEQFVARLRTKFPNAEIELLTEAWGGRNSDTYRNEPPGSPKNYAEKVLALKPDLIVSEFVNDSGMHGDYLDKRYSEILADFKEISAEWIILTPHYVRCDWMGLATEKNIDDDPRPYTQSVRQFCAKNNVALADGAKRYGRLWRQGIPYSTLMSNDINHPNKEGMKLFADALMELF
jgi:lysophospholipase L1-like esterase